MFSITPYRISPASSKLGLLCTGGSSHRCMKVLEPSFAELLDGSSGPFCCTCAGLENREREALVFDEIMFALLSELHSGGGEGKGGGLAPFLLQNNQCVQHTQASFFFLSGRATT
jgi:hypothetical protein